MIYPPKDEGDPYRVRLAPLTDAEVTAALGGYRGRRMTWACADEATARAFDRIVNGGDLTASPHRATFAVGFDRYELADRAIDRALDIVANGPRLCADCGLRAIGANERRCRVCRPKGTRPPRQAVPFAEREAKRRAHAGALARVGI